MKRVVLLLTTVLLLLLLSSCSNAAFDSAGRELEDAVANTIDADNKYVQMVKGGYRADNPDVTYEEAFTSFFAVPRWKYFEGEDGQNVVEFTGDCMYEGVQVKARIQFVVDEENQTFEATYLAFNEVPQNALMLAAVISKAFEDPETSDVNSEPVTMTYMTYEYCIFRFEMENGILSVAADDGAAASDGFGAQEPFSFSYPVAEDCIWEDGYWGLENEYVSYQQRDMKTVGEDIKMWRDIYETSPYDLESPVTICFDIVDDVVVRVYTVTS